MKLHKGRRPAYFKKSPIKPIQSDLTGSGMFSALHDLRDWSGLGILMLLITTTYFLGDVAPVLRTFKFWAILSAVLMCTAVVLYLKIKSVLARPLRRMPPYWAILSNGCLYSGFLGFLCLLTAGYVAIIFAP